MRALHRELAWNLGVAAASAHLVVTWNGLARRFLDLDAYVHGVTMKPYQYRALMGWIARAALSLVDVESLTARLSARPAPFDRPATLVFMAVQVSCCVWLVRELRAWLAERSGSDAFGSWAAPGVLAVLPASLYAYTGANWYFPSDLPAVAFDVALLRMAAHARWRWFYPLFALATLNRESTLLVTAAVALANLTRPRVATTHLAAQLTLWCAVKFALACIYRSEPAEGPLQVVVVHPELNLTYLEKPWWWLHLASAVSFLWVLGFAFWRRHEDRHLRAIMATFPAYVAAMFVVGHLAELRVFVEYVPFFYAALCLVAWRALRSPPTAPLGL